jgi:hypothetical protein
MKNTIQSFLNDYSDGLFRQARVIVGIESVIISIPQNLGLFSDVQLERLSRAVTELVGKPVMASQAGNEMLEKLQFGISTLLKTNLQMENPEILLDIPAVRKCNVTVFCSGNDLRVAREKHDLIKHLIHAFFKLYQIELVDVGIQAEVDSNFSDIQILLAVAKLAPVTSEACAQHMTTSLEKEITEKLVSLRLNILQKKKMVVWQRRGTYALSLSGLRVCSEVIGRKKFDIARVLALGKSKW